MEPGKKLRAAFEAPGATLVALVGDAQSARLAEIAGYAAASMGTAGVTNGLLGMPDVGLLTLTEMEFVASRAAEACDIPILVGAETGYGNAIHMARAIRALDQAGVAGAFIEDKEHPATAPSGGPTISMAEMVGKIKAAADARKHDSFLLIARTDAALKEGVDAAIERGRAYVEAGADGFFCVGASLEDRPRVMQEVPASFHIAVLGASGTLQDFDRMGFQVVLTNHAPTHVGALAMLRAFEEIRRTGRSGDEEWRQAAAGTPLENWELGDHGQISRIDMQAMMQRYLPAETDQ